MGCDSVDGTCAIGGKEMPWVVVSQRALNVLLGFEIFSAACENGKNFALGVGGGKGVGRHTYREVQTFSQTDHTSVNSIQLKKEIITKNPIALLQELPNHKRK